MTVKDTLVLNSDGAPLSLLPLSTISWQSAINRMLMDRVIVLEWYDDWIIHSQSWETPVPAVVMTKNFVRKSATPAFTRQNLALRDRFTCQYCSTRVALKDITMDHVIPHSLGGPKTWDNIVVSCGPCNHKKADKHAKPIQAPYEPTYYELVAIHKSLNPKYKVKHISWNQYLS